MDQLLRIKEQRRAGGNITSKKKAHFVMVVVSTIETIDKDYKGSARQSRGAQAIRGQVYEAGM